MDKFPYVSVFQHSVAAAEEIPITREVDIIPEDEHKQEALQIIDVAQVSTRSPRIFSHDSEARHNQLKAVCTDLSSTSSELPEPYHHLLKLSVRNSSELVMLESLLSQFLQQVCIVFKGKRPKYPSYFRYLFEYPYVVSFILLGYSD